MTGHRGEHGTAHLRSDFLISNDMLSNSVITV